VEEQERVYEAALAAIKQGKPAAVATLISVRGRAPREVGAKMLVYADGGIVGTVGGGQIEAAVIEKAQAAIVAGQSGEMVYVPLDPHGEETDSCGDELRFFIEVLRARETLLVVGGGHIGQALTELGHFLGFHVVVLDERPDMLDSERFSEGTQFMSGPVAEVLQSFPITLSTYIVFVTPHSSRDEKALVVLADREPAYIGLLGSNRRRAATFKRARELGVPERLIEQVHAPVGLAIGAQTPREIAVSILAEIIAVQRGKVV